MTVQVGVPRTARSMRIADIDVAGKFDYRIAVVEETVPDKRAITVPSSPVAKLGGYVDKVAISLIVHDAQPGTPSSQVGVFAYLRDVMFCGSGSLP
jgi:hypothetical protein